MWNTFQGGIDIKMIIKGTMEGTEDQSNNARTLKEVMEETLSVLLSKCAFILFFKSLSSNIKHCTVTVTKMFSSKNSCKGYRNTNISSFIK